MDEKGRTYYRIVGPKEEVYAVGHCVRTEKEHITLSYQPEGSEWLLSFTTDANYPDYRFWRETLDEKASHSRFYYFSDGNVSGTPRSNDVTKKYFSYNYVLHVTVGPRTPSRLWRIFCQHPAYVTKDTMLYFDKENPRLVFHSYWQKEELHHQLQRLIADDEFPAEDLIATFTEEIWGYRWLLDFRIAIRRVYYRVDKPQGYLLKELNECAG